MHGHEETGERGRQENVICNGRGKDGDRESDDCQGGGGVNVGAVCVM